MNKRNLIKALQVQTSSRDERQMRKFIKRFAKTQHNAKIHFNADNIYITKGKADIYPCVVAHMDTVHRIYDDFRVFEINDNLVAFDGVSLKQVGIGGDDKVGVFIALEMLREFENIKVAFFSQEEIGCVGSGKAKMDFFDDCAFVLQCDRKGNSDFIFKGCSTELFGSAFERKIDPLLDKYKYNTATGSLTDVITLKDNGLKVAAANISCGYYNPHMYTEHVNVTDVTNCYNLVHDIIRILGRERHFHIKAEEIFSYNNKLNRYNDNYNDTNNFMMTDAATVTPKHIPYKTPVGWCNKCGYIVVTDLHSHPLCKGCKRYVDGKGWTSYKTLHEKGRILREKNRAKVLLNKVV